MYNRYEKYYSMWKADKENIICTMYRNLTADLEAGYDPVGDTITKEQAEIEAYKAEYKALHSMLIELATDEGWNAVNRWCYKDMVKRGVIE